MKLKFLMVLLGIILLILIIYFSGIEATIQAILNSNLNFILLALVFFTAETFLKSLRWKTLLKSIGAKIPFSHAFYSFNSAMFLRITELAHLGHNPRREIL